MQITVHITIKIVLLPEVYCRKCTIEINCYVSVTIYFFVISTLFHRGKYVDDVISHNVIENVIVFNYSCTCCWHVVYYK
jgi:hypothetical protein